MRLGDLLFIVAWLALLIGVLDVPVLINPIDPGELLIRWTIRLSLAYWAGAATLMLLARPNDWLAPYWKGRLARWCWTFAWATYLVHLAMAFHFYHGWSHADAMDHTREVSGTGEGIYVSHLFTLVWTIDVFFWWCRPAWYAARPRWVGWLLHAFMVFIIFNGMVVYETGVIRWAGILMFTWLAAACGVALFHGMTNPPRRHLLRTDGSLDGTRGS